MNIKSPEDTFTLANGVGLPCIGFGTYNVDENHTAEAAVRTAIRVGYRSIDAAASYHNETEVGRGIKNGLKENGLQREDIFVTSKVWKTDMSYDRAIQSAEKSIRDLDIGYLDLLLIHWPASPSQFDDWEKRNLETWRALTDLYRDGKVRAIGVSNFLPEHLTPLLDTDIPPMVDQIEFHPGYPQFETVRFCQEKGIRVEAWSPLARKRMLNNSLLGEIAEQTGKSPAQICLRWVLQHDICPLPKSTHEERILENIDIFDFSLSPDAMQKIDDLPEDGFSGLHPDTVTF